MSKIVNVTYTDITADIDGVGFNDKGEYVTTENGAVVIKELHTKDSRAVCTLNELEDFKDAIAQFEQFYENGTLNIH